MFESNGHSIERDDYWTLGLDLTDGKVWHAPLRRTIDGWELPCIGVEYRLQGVCTKLVVRCQLRYDIPPMTIDYGNWADHQEQVVPL